MEDACTISGLDGGRPFNSKIFATAAASSAFAPRPYTVSVGNATSLPSRIRAAASLMEIIFAVGRGLAGFAEYKECVDQGVQIAVQHAVHVAHGKFRPMILNQ